MHSWYHAGIALFTQHAVKKICIHTICYFEIKHTWTQIKYFNSCYFFIFSVPQVWNLHKTGLIFTLNRGNVIVQLSGRKKSNNPSFFSTNFQFFQTTHAPWRMLKAPSVIPQMYIYRSSKIGLTEGHYYARKYVWKSSRIRKKVENCI